VLRCQEEERLLLRKGLLLIRQPSSLTFAATILTKFESTGGGVVLICRSISLRKNRYLRFWKERQEGE